MHGFVMQYHANCNSYYFLNKWVENRRKKRFPPHFLELFICKDIFLVCIHPHKYKMFAIFQFLLLHICILHDKNFLWNLTIADIFCVCTYFFVWVEKPKSFCKIYSTTKEVIHLLINRLQIYDIYAWWNDLVKRFSAILLE